MVEHNTTSLYLYQRGKNRVHQLMIDSTIHGNSLLIPKKGKPSIPDAIEKTDEQAFFVLFFKRYKWLWLWATKPNYVAR